MRTLVVRQSLGNGANRTWRLRPTGEPVTLGSSRLAGLTSIDPQSAGIEGAFECADGQWRWISMHPTRLSETPVTILTAETVLRLAQSEVRVGFHEKDDSVFRKLESATRAEAGTGTTPYELEIVKFGDRVLSTRVLKAGAKESKRARAALEMKEKGADQFQVLRRPVHLDSVKDMMSQPPGANMDREAKRGTAIVAVCSVLFAVAAVFGPKPDAVVAAAPLPQGPQITVNLAPVKPKKAERAPAAIQPPQETAGANNAPKGGRVAGMFKSLNGGRLSQLLGKVSAQAARSREVVVANGVKAGEGPSGRALAALGKVDRGGGDWSGAAKGTGVSVSTAGSGGGRGVAGLAGLTAGKTGTGGVGLIEDESEITGGLDREIIAQTIKAYLGQILYCYERQLSASPELFGKVAVRFTIGPTGSVETQNIGDTTLRNATVEGCILNKVASWKFPAPSGGTKVMVTYPFLFKSTN